MMDAPQEERSSWISVQFFVEMTCESCAQSVRAALAGLFAGPAADRYSVKIDVEEQDVVLSWDVFGTGFGVETVLLALEENTGLKTAVHGVGVLGLSSACGALEFPYVPEGFELSAELAERYTGVVRGTIRLAQLPTVGEAGDNTTAGAQPSKNALLDVTLSNCVPHERYGIELRSFGDFSQGFESMGATMATWVDANAKESNCIANDKGTIRLRSVVAVDVPGTVGRGVVVINSAGTAVSGAVSARSAGVLQNKKKICLCDNPSF